MEQSNQTAVRYAIDPGVSRLTVRAFATGMLSAFGHHPVIAAGDFTGEAGMLEGTLEHASLSVTVNGASLTVENDINDKDRREMQRAMHEDVLETQRFPEISYKCSSISGTQSGDGQFFAVLNGSLTLHGVTRLQPISARVFVAGNLLRASGEFVLRQSDFLIKPVSAVAGALRLKDELTIGFEIVARKQEQRADIRGTMPCA